jgi:hypothetical protein
MHISTNAIQESTIHPILFNKRIFYYTNRTFSGHCKVFNMKTISL